MKLIVGLGNPGRDYANNRHNVGFACLNHFSRKYGIRFDRKQALARIGIGEVAGHEVVLAKPQTYMNLSGQSVSRLMHRFNVNLADLLIIHDDLDLPVGKIRIRHDSGSGGHKGVGSIISSLESQSFSRLRVGIGRPTVESSTEISEADVVTYVLSGFTSEEKRIIPQVIPRVSEVTYCLLSEGLTKAMNKHN